MRAGDLGKRYRDRDLIVCEGEVGDCMFVVQEGSAEVVQEVDGEESRLTVLGPGDFFGEMALFDDEVRSASVRAVGEVRMLTVDRRTLMRRLHEDPSLAYEILKRLSRRIKELSRDVGAGGAAGADADGGPG